MTDDQPLAEAGREGSLGVVHEAECAALANGGVGEAHTATVNVAAVALGPLEPHARAHGVITVARGGRAFIDDDLDVIRSLGAEAALALENIELHFQVRRPGGHGRAHRARKSRPLAGASER